MDVNTTDYNEEPNQYATAAMGKGFRRTSWPVPIQTPLYVKVDGCLVNNGVVTNGVYGNMQHSLYQQQLSKLRPQQLQHQQHPQQQHQQQHPQQQHQQQHPQQQHQQQRPQQHQQQIQQMQLHSVQHQQHYQQQQQTLHRVGSSTSPQFQNSLGSYWKQPYPAGSSNCGNQEQSFRQLLDSDLSVHRDNSAVKNVNSVDFRRLENYAMNSYAVANPPSPSHSLTTASNFTIYPRSSFGTEKGVFRFTGRSESALSVQQFNPALNARQSTADFENVRFSPANSNSKWQHVNQAPMRQIFHDQALSFPSTVLPDVPNAVRRGNPDPYSVVSRPGCEFRRCNSDSKGAQPSSSPLFLESQARSGENRLLADQAMTDCHNWVRSSTQSSLTTPGVHSDARGVTLKQLSEAQQLPCDQNSAMFQEKPVDRAFSQRPPSPVAQREQSNDGIGISLHQSRPASLTQQSRLEISSRELVPVRGAVNQTPAEATSCIRKALSTPALRPVILSSPKPNANVQSFDGDVQQTRYSTLLPKPSPPAPPNVVLHSSSSPTAAVSHVIAPLQAKPLSSATGNVFCAFDHGTQSIPSHSWSMAPAQSQVVVKVVQPGVDPKSRAVGGIGVGMTPRSGVADLVPQRAAMSVKVVPMGVQGVTGSSGSAMLEQAMVPPESAAGGMLSCITVNNNNVGCNDSSSCSNNIGRNRVSISNGSSSNSKCSSSSISCSSSGVNSSSISNNNGRNNLGGVSSSCVSSSCVSSSCVSSSCVSSSCVSSSCVSSSCVSSSCVSSSGRVISNGISSGSNISSSTISSSNNSNVSSSSISSSIMSGSSKEMAIKCQVFLTKLLRLSSDRNRETHDRVLSLCQQAIDGVMSLEQFAPELGVTLGSQPQSTLLPFLKAGLPLLCDAMRLGKVQIPGLGAPVTELTALVTSVRERGVLVSPMEVTDPGVLISPCQATMLSMTSSSQAEVHEVSVSQKNGYSSSRVAGSKVSRSSGHVVKATLVPDSYHSGAQSGVKRRFESIRDEDDINDVASMGGVNLTEESRHIMAATSHHLASGGMRSCGDEPFFSESLLSDRTAALARRHALAGVSAEVPLILSHALEARLRHLLTRLSIIAAQRRREARAPSDVPRNSVSIEDLQMILEHDKLSKESHLLFKSYLR